MTINVTGVLQDPLGNTIDATIRVTATSTGDVVLGSRGTVLVGADGAYTLTLANGSFLIEIVDTEAYDSHANVTIDDTVLTDASYTMENIFDLDATSPDGEAILTTAVAALAVRVTALEVNHP